MSKLGSFSASARIGDVEVTLDGGKLAQQAGGAVTAQLGETILLVTTTASRQPKEHLDFFPLTVDFEEKMYAAGRIPGGFFKREGRPSENAILTCRLVDRPMRPTFADGLRNEIQILITTLSADQVNPPDVLAINGASAATMLAGIPFAGPVAGVRMGMDRDGRWKPFPTFTWLEEEAVFDLVVAGRLNKTSGDIDILMVEAEATASAVEKIEMGATKPTEEVLGAALEEAKGYLRQLCDLQNEFVAKAPAGARRASTRCSPSTTRASTTRSSATPARTSAASWSTAASTRRPATSRPRSSRSRRSTTSSTRPATSTSPTRSSSARPRTRSSRWRRR